jgi:hypothetical protein
MIQDPPIISHKGRPRTTRISGANEGEPRGGGPTNTQRKSQRVHQQAAPEEGSNEREQPAPQTSRVYRCGLCWRVGHNWNNCDWA